MSWKMKAALALACASVLGTAMAEAADVPTDEASDFGYAIGVDLGKSLKAVEGSVDVDQLKQGLDDAMAGKTPRLNEEQREAVKKAVAQKLQAAQLAARQADGDKARVDGVLFLKENARKPGVKVTASGLQYLVLREGKGEYPTDESIVTVHYRGSLLDGSVFDESYSRETPVEFPLSGVIQGWTEGVKLMRPGAKYRLFIPANLAYGDRGAGTKIGPNQTLIFEIELLKVK